MSFAGAGVVFWDGEFLDALPANFVGRKMPGHSDGDGCGPAFAPESDMGMPFVPTINTVCSGKKMNQTGGYAAIKLAVGRATVLVQLDIETRQLCISSKEPLDATVVRLQIKFNHALCPVVTTGPIPTGKPVMWRCKVSKSLCAPFKRLGGVNVSLSAV